MFFLRSALFLLIIVCGVGVIASSHGSKCVLKEFQRGLSCVCNSTYCDEIEIQDPPEEGYHVYTSSDSGLRFNLTTVNARSCNGRPDVTITINPSDKRQKIFGFGGALTDATGINIQCLSKKTQERLLNSYFGKTGIEYNYVRIPIAGCDFSVRPYLYVSNDTADPSLSTFQLAEEDLNTKIPLLKSIKKISKREIKLMASPWYAPAWMATAMCNRSNPVIAEEYYQTWATYFKLFLDNYKKYGLTFDSITTGNEPQAGLVSQGWCLEDMSKFIADALGPLLKSSYPNVKIFNLDDQTTFVTSWMTSFNIPEVNKYVDGLATHWYLDFGSQRNLIPGIHNNYHQMFPGKSLISTEASACQYESSFFTSSSWGKAARYIDDHIIKLANFLNGWIDWNMVLDLQGGPNHISNFCDAPIIVNCTADEFYKQPTFYAMGHLSKFIPPGSHAIGSTQESSPDIESVAFITPKSQVVIHVHNRSRNPKTVNIRNQGECSTVTLPPQSISSIVSST